MAHDMCGDIVTALRLPRSIRRSWILRLERLFRARLGECQDEVLQRAATRVVTKRCPKNEEKLGEPRLLSEEIVRLTIELGWLN